MLLPGEAAGDGEFFSLEEADTEVGTLPVSPAHGHTGSQSSMTLIPLGRAHRHTLTQAASFPIEFVQW